MMLNFSHISYKLNIVSKGDEPDVLAAAGEVGEDIFLAIMRGSTTTNISLTNLTHTELDAMREFFLIAFANAQGIVKERDRLAKEGLENGDDSFVRLYRTVPTILIREGEKWKHYPRLRRGFEWVTSMVPKYNVNRLDIRGSSVPVPEPVKAEPVADNGEEEAGIF